MARFVAALLLFSSVTNVLASGDVVGTIMQRIAARSGTNRSTSHVNDTVGLLVFSKQDLRRTSARGKHAAVAVSGAGDVIGVLLRNSGLVACEFGGFFDGQCLTLSGCVTGSRCL